MAVCLPERHDKYLCWHECDLMGIPRALCGRTALTCAPPVRWKAQVSEYGDADRLEATAPDDVRVVRWGHTRRAEQYQIALLEDLGVPGISAIPCLLYRDRDGAWGELRIADLAEWSWPVVEGANVNREPTPQEGAEAAALAARLTVVDKVRADELDDDTVAGLVALFPVWGGSGST